MKARAIGTMILVATLVGSGAYVFIYLDRWEWSRALIAGLFFIAAEMGLAVTYLAARLQRLEARLGSAPPSDAVHERVRSHLVESAPAAHDHFAWMRSSMQRTSVFIPVLMGAGIILSGIAWLVERVARATAKPAMEGRLATRLLPISLPERPIVRAEHAPPTPTVALLLRPSRNVPR